MLSCLVMLCSLYLVHGIVFHVSRPKRHLSCFIHSSQNIPSPSTNFSQCCLPFNHPRLNDEACFTLLDGELKAGVVAASSDVIAPHALIALAVASDWLEHASVDSGLTCFCHFGDGSPVRWKKFYNSIIRQVHVGKKKA